MGAPRGPRAGRLYAVTIGDETHIVKASSIIGALRFAVDGVVTVVPIGAKNTELLRGREIHNAMHMKTTETEQENV